MHLVLWAEDYEAELRSELMASFPGTTVTRANGLFQSHLSPDPSSPEAERGTGFEIVPGVRLPYLAFARQLLPNARMLAAESVRAWAAQLFDVIISSLPEGQPWSLHLEPHYGASVRHRIGARAWHSLRMRAKSQSRESLPAPN